MERPCSQCGRPVEPREDALRVTLRGYRISGRISAEKEAELLEENRSKHLFPLVEEDVEVCAGSRSMARYCGGPPDTRPEYPYNNTDAEVYGKAFVQIRAENDSDQK